MLACSPLLKFRAYRYVVRIVLAVMCSLLCCAAVYAQDDAKSIINVEQVQLRPVNEQWHLHALLDITLSRDMRRGLDSGVPLHFVLNFKIKTPRQFWPDTTVLSLQQRFSLTYYELTRHYRLQAIDMQKSRNFRSLLAALEALGQIPAITVSVPDTAPLIGHLSMELDQHALPLPLKSLFSSTWRMASEEFVWPIN